MVGSRSCQTRLRSTKRRRTPSIGPGVVTACVLADYMNDMLQKIRKERAREDCRSSPWITSGWARTLRTETRQIRRASCRLCRSRMSTRFVWASVVPAKGVDLYAVLKSDNESSIKALKSAIKEGIKSVEIVIVMEEGKTGDSQSNGSCEVAVRETKRRPAREDGSEDPFEAPDPCMGWAPRVLHAITVPCWSRRQNRL